MDLEDISSVSLSRISGDKSWRLCCGRICNHETALLHSANQKAAFGEGGPRHAEDDVSSDIRYDPKVSTANRKS